MTLRKSRLTPVPEPGYRDSQGRVIRRNKIGHRIGHNWWREHITDLLFCATAAWDRECEAVALGYATEMAEYALLNPRPNLKEFLVGHQGMTRIV